MASSVEPAQSPGAARGSLWRRPTARPVAVVLAVLAALTVWTASELVFGVDVRQPAFGSGVPQDLTAGPIVIASVVVGLAAWLALALLERITRHARAAWVALATLTLAASLVAPLSGRGIDGGSRLVLTLLHLTVGTLLIVLLARTSRPAIDHAEGRSMMAETGSVFSQAELDYLHGQRLLGRIATVGGDGTPHVAPVGWAHNAALDTIDVTGHGLEQTKKFRDVARTGRAAIVIDDLASVSPWRPRAIEIRGRAEALPTPEALIRIHPERIVSWGHGPGRSARTVTRAASP